MGPPPPPPLSSSFSSSQVLLLFTLIIITLSKYPFFNNNTIIVAYAESNIPEETPPPTPIPKDIIDIPHQNSSTFKPGVAIVAGALTLIFSLTFLLLLFIKHCSGNETSTNTTTSINLFSASAPSLPSITGRKNSGIDRTVVDSLPIFRFGSLRGQKDGLDCAVCLNKFESAEVLRLLPKCKHAFHVECVDTWLDAHSTCPLCRCRVDPEDILLVMEDAKKSSTKGKEEKEEEEECLDIEKGTVAFADSKRRHSSVGEREWERRRKTTSSFRWSLDSKKKEGGVGIVGIGCFVRPRKDGLLLTKEEREKERGSVERRLEHRIIVSPSPSGVHQRWSDVQPCDLLYLTSEMIISEARRLQQQRRRSSTSMSRNDDDGVGRGIINSRSVSEITGLSRFPSNRNRNNNNNEGLISRWLAWISQSRSQPAVR